MANLGEAGGRFMERVEGDDDLRAARPLDYENGTTSDEIFISRSDNGAGLCLLPAALLQ